jgi:hypothetical protein
MAFDLLYRDGRDVSARPLRDRRARLEDVVAGNNLIFAVRRLSADGLEAWKQVVERGFEGYVGGVMRRWLKVKQRNWTLVEDRWQRTMFANGRQLPRNPKSVMLPSNVIHERSSGRSRDRPSPPCGYCRIL